MASKMLTSVSLAMMSMHASENNGIYARFEKWLAESSGDNRIALVWCDGHCHIVGDIVISLEKFDTQNNKKPRIKKIFWSDSGRYLPLVSQDDKIYIWDTDGNNFLETMLDKDICAFYAQIKETSTHARAIRTKTTPYIAALHENFKNFSS